MARATQRTFPQWHSRRTIYPPNDHLDECKPASASTERSSVGFSAPPCPTKPRKVPRNPPLAPKRSEPTTRPAQIPKTLNIAVRIAGSLYCAPLGSPLFSSDTKVREIVGLIAIASFTRGGSATESAVETLRRRRYRVLQSFFAGLLLVWY
jgi:hypothetical protein